MNWDEIFTRIDALNQERNMERERALMEFFVKRDLLKSNNLTPEQKKEIYADYQRLAAQLNRQ